MTTKKRTNLLENFNSQVLFRKKKLSISNKTKVIMMHFEENSRELAFFYSNIYP